MNVRRLLLRSLACCALLASLPARAVETVPPMADLRADGAQARLEGKPVLLFFSLPDCKYCEEVRRNYLLPLLRGPAQLRPLIREGELTGAQPITGFDGKPATPRQLAEQYHVRFAPTLLFLDSQGRQLIEPLVGGDTSGMYNAYLDRALDESARALREQSPPG